MAVKRNSANLDVLRRRAVASASIQGMSPREIYVWLEDKGLIDPDTGKPFSVSQIRKDIDLIVEEWNERMYKDISFHRARVLAELAEVKSSAWKSSKLSIVLKAIDKEVDLLGLNELERLHADVAIANLLKGLPAEVSSALRERLTERVGEKRGKAEALKKIGFNQYK